MNYLRLTPAEYGDLARVCRPPDVSRPPLSKLRRLLVASLTDSSPLLAGRVHRLRWGELRAIRDHFRGPQPPHGLGTGEVEALAEAFGPLVCRARFARSLRRDLGGQLRGAAPGLGRKVGWLS